MGRSSPFGGKRVADADWPPGSLVVSIQRGSQLLFPEGDTVIEPGDTLSLLTVPVHAATSGASWRDRSLKRRTSPPGPDMI